MAAQRASCFDTTYYMQRNKAGSFHCLIADGASKPHGWSHAVSATIVLSRMLSSVSCSFQSTQQSAAFSACLVWLCVSALLGTGSSTCYCASPLLAQGKKISLQDLPASLGQSPEAAFDHFVHYGQWEGRPFRFTCGMPLTRGTAVSHRSLLP